MLSQSRKEEQVAVTFQYSVLSDVLYADPHKRRLKRWTVYPLCTQVK
jgi:hypothetical protein